MSELVAVITNSSAPRGPRIDRSKVAYLSYMEAWGGKLQFFLVRPRSAPFALLIGSDRAAGEVDRWVVTRVRSGALPGDGPHETPRDWLSAAWSVIAEHIEFDRAQGRLLTEEAVSLEGVGLDAVDRGDELAVIRNIHIDAPQPYEGRVVSYFENEYGEQALFLPRGAGQWPHLLHGDLGWEPEAVTSAGLGGIILADAERAWLTACLRPLRGTDELPHRRDTPAIKWGPVWVSEDPQFESRYRIAKGHARTVGAPARFLKKLGEVGLVYASGGSIEVDLGGVLRAAKKTEVPDWSISASDPGVEAQFRAFLAGRAWLQEAFDTYDHFAQ